MNFSKKIPLLLALSVAFLKLNSLDARAEVSFNFFYENLDPYGEWIETGTYGYCWRPWGVDEDWAPYTDGYWAYTDGGWTWVSYEDFGPITYHYGRWTRLAGIGWCWVPGYEWAPAWVSWRSGDSYIGWAPLPPECHFRPAIGISFWVDTTYGIGPDNYNFCSYRDFASPYLRPVIVNRTQNVTIINNTTNITNITVNRARNMVYNGGPVFATIATRTQRPIQTLTLAPVRDVNALRASGGSLLARQQGSQLVVAAPKVAPPPEKARPPHVARTLTKVDVDHGWRGVSDPQLRQQTEAAMKRQVAGVKPEQAPAKPVTTAELNAFAERVKTAPQNPLAGTPPPQRGKRGAADQPVTTPFLAATPTPQAAGQPAIPTPAPDQKSRRGHAEKPVTSTPVPAPTASAAQPLVATPKPGQGNSAASASTPTVDPRALENERQLQEKKQQHAAEAQQRQLQEQQQVKEAQQRAAREREAQIQQQHAAEVQQRQIQEQQHAKEAQQQAAREREAQIQQQHAAEVQQQRAVETQQRQLQAQQAREAQTQALREREAQIQQRAAAAQHAQQIQAQQQKAQAAQHAQGDHKGKNEEKKDEEQR